MKVVKAIIVCLILIIIVGSVSGPVFGDSTRETTKIKESLPTDEEALASKPDQLIRFHVIANSDSEQDQALKRAVRDAILKEVSPQLAVSKSLAESRQILKKIRPQMEEIARLVIKAWGKDYSVHTEYGHFGFPTKSYGTLVLPAGEYEALRVVIGEGQGSNWWCVLFPPLCFIDIEHSTAVQVDGKPGIPLNSEPKTGPTKQMAGSTDGLPKVRFFFWELIERIF
jgi:stage II sporulation protein R